jgi:flagellar motor switch protein FliG
MTIKYDELTATQKAAIALIAFGTEVSAEVLKGLSDSELERITIEIANMRDIPGDVEDKVIDECYQIFLAREYIVQGGVDFAQSVLEQAVGSKRAGEIMRRLESSLVTSGFNLLKNIDAKQLVNIIQNEHPQTISLILTQLTPLQAAAALTEFPPELQSEVATRLATMEKISPEILKDIEATLDKHFSDSAFRDSKHTGGAKALADILNLAETAAEKNILSSLETEDPDLALPRRTFSPVLKPRTPIWPRRSRT